MENENQRKFGKLSSLDVIRLSVEGKLPEGEDIEKFLKRLVTLLQNPHYNLLQFNNMVLLLQLVAPYTVEFHTFSLGSTKELIDNYNGVFDVLEKQGVKKLRTYAEDKGFLKIAKMIERPIHIYEEERMMGDKKTKVYVYELDL